MKADPMRQCQEGLNGLSYAAKHGQTKVLSALAADLASKTQQRHQEQVADSKQTAGSNSEGKQSERKQSEGSDTEGKQVDSHTPLFQDTRSANAKTKEVFDGAEGRRNELASPLGLLANDRGGRSPLSLAAANGHVECIAVLAAWKADVNGRDNLGNTAAHHAARHDQGDAVRALFSAKADLELENTASKPPLTVAGLNKKDNAKMAIIQSLMQ